MCNGLPVSTTMVKKDLRAHVISCTQTIVSQPAFNIWLVYHHVNSREKTERWYFHVTALHRILVHAFQKNIFCDMAIWPTITREEVQVVERHLVHVIANLLPEMKIVCKRFGQAKGQGTKETISIARSGFCCSTRKGQKLETSCCPIIKYGNHLVWKRQIENITGILQILSCG